MAHRKSGLGMVMPTHHVSDDLLLAYAAGSCSEAESLLVATHLTLCPACREQESDFEALGGALLAEMPGEPVGDKLLDSVLARLDESGSAADSDRRSGPGGRPPVDREAGRDDIVLPRPLQAYVRSGIDALPWSTLKRGIEQYPLAVSVGGPVRAKLLRLRSGIAVPAHTHAGTELTLVLSGGFSDDRGHFLRGDVAFADEEVDHRPVADEGEDCLCLTVLDAPLRLTGTFGRLLNPFLRF